MDTNIKLLGTLKRCGLIWLTISSALLEFLCLLCILVSPTWWWNSSGLSPLAVGCLWGSGQVVHSKMLCTRKAKSRTALKAQMDSGRGHLYEENAGNLDYELYGTILACLENLFPVWFKSLSGICRHWVDRVVTLCCMFRVLSAFQGTCVPWMLGCLWDKDA